MLIFAHHKSLNKGGGGSKAAPVHKLLKSIFPLWKQVGCPRWDINLSWEGHYSGKMRRYVACIVFADAKSIMMKEGGRKEDK